VLDRLAEAADGGNKRLLRPLQAAYFLSVSGTDVTILDQAELSPNRFDIAAVLFGNGGLCRLVERDAGTRPVQVDGMCCRFED
jgi:hypothetical protein